MSSRPCQEANCADSWSIRSVLETEYAFRNKKTDRQGNAGFKFLFYLSSRNDFVTI